MKYMTPVILLSDGFIANGSEPWRLPDAASLPDIDVRLRSIPDGFEPYARDTETLARPWAVPGTPGLEHRVGGLEKSSGSGNVSYDPANHEMMIRIRGEKVQRVTADIPPLETTGDDSGLLVLGWGSTYGAITGAVRRARDEGRRVGQLHLRHLNPLPDDLESVLDRYDDVLLPEINMGQLAFTLQGRFVRPIHQLNKVRGLPFSSIEIYSRILELTDKGKA
jgi:2-oxoglutarate ferredoxin oxidoreductase subunit alpha